MAIIDIFSNFGTIHINGIYSIIYFLTNNIFFFVVILSIYYLIKLDMEYSSEDFVNDERSVI